jgi:hypothetical protein
MQPIDAWGINVEHLGPVLYARILRVVAGKEPPAQGKEVTTEFKFMLPYFVLCGLAGHPELRAYSIAAIRIGNVN